MHVKDLGHEAQQAIEHVLGYLNFSSGTADPSVLASLNLLFGAAERCDQGTPAAWQQVDEWLGDALKRLRAESPAFRDAEQASAVLDLVFRGCLPAYLEFHRDLLFHQTPDRLFRPFFVGRVCEAVLAQGPPWGERDRIIGSAIGRLNDFIGHRPVAVLETQKLEPYPHEWVRPVPIYVRGAGISVGYFQSVVQLALDFLREAPEIILTPAHFHFDQLEEMALDPRAYDFEHPVNKRPNYHFGQWDPHCIDMRGRYTRFVIQEVTLDALMSRLHVPGKVPRGELEFEAAAVLAGTILMASGTSGSGPGTYDSTTSLTDILPVIAQYRDLFYEYLLRRLEGPHGDRLEREANQKRQPFGGARQHLNAEMARRRASQLEHVHLARIFASMGYPEAAARQADVVPVASARMICRIDCRLTEGSKLLRRGALSAAAEILPGTVDLLKRAIECGAVVDPWNILGFDAQFPLFPAIENSVHDHRVDDLLQLIERIISLYSNVWSEAAAVSDEAICTQMDRQFRELTEWWRKFAVHECSSVKWPDPEDIYQAAKLVTTALGLWHRGGAAAGDIAFWAPHAEMFPSPEAYALVIDALLARQDHVAAMALLMHWLSQAARIPLVQGDSSFYQLAVRWLSELPQPTGDAPHTSRWKLIHKFFDYLEANADEYWSAPEFQFGTPRREGGPDDAEEDHEEDHSLFDAAYDNVVYRDATDDGIEGPLYEVGYQSDDEFENEARRLIDRLSFLRCLARLWKNAAISEQFRTADSETAARRREALRRWSEQAAANRRRLMSLLDSVREYRLPAPSGDHDSMVEYDRRRMAKDSLLEQIIGAGVETVDASRLLVAAAFTPTSLLEHPEHAALEEDERESLCLLSALLHQQRDLVRGRWPSFEAALRRKPLLYVPVTKGGDPRAILAARVRQKTIQDLLIWLPRVGLLVEACRLIELARAMERSNSVGPGAVTEFDELYTLGYKSLVECIVDSYEQWPRPRERGGKKAREQVLVSCLEKLTESLLVSWLAHSQTLRLSVMESLYEDEAWKDLLAFVMDYGGELFTQRFLNLGNIRAILHEGVDVWLEQMSDNPRVQLRLLDDIERGLPRSFAVKQLSIVLEAIIENYAEYRDYNSTTTQSDRGEMLYVLLDFLRLQSRYDRISWHLRPVVLAHELLCRRGCNEAARIWRRELSERIHDKASEFVAELRQLQRRYAVRMPTIADRISERFVQPLTIDRIKALVEPAMAAANGGKPKKVFEQLERETDMLTREPTGAGLDVPAWLEALEDEVERLRRPVHARDDDEALRQMLPATLLSYEDTLAQLRLWADEVAKKSRDSLRFRHGD